MSADPLRPAALELATAEAALQSMKQAKSMEEFRRAWGHFLDAIEKLWNKSEPCCISVRPTFQPWQGRYHRLRKKDMLLRYLKQARDADNHSVQEITAVEPGRRAMRFANPRGGFVKRLEVRNGEIVRYEGDPMIIEDTVPHPIAVRVLNGGEWFNPPTSHLDQPVPSHHPVLLAEMGVAFYRSYLEEIRTEFFGSRAEGGG